jgi:hypothetical protein
MDNEIDDYYEEEYNENIYENEPNKNQITFLKPDEILEERDKIIKEAME